MPVQPTGGVGIHGTVEVFDEFQAGLNDLDGFSHIIVLYYFHRSTDYKLHVTPFLDSTPQGLFSTRALNRPNSTGLSIVKPDKIDGRILNIKNIDMLDGTPLLDIKPYVPAFDQQKDVRFGWLETTEAHVSTQRSDDRFKQD